MPENRILAGTHPAQIAHAARRPDDQAADTGNMDVDIDDFLQRTSEEQFLLPPPDDGSDDIDTVFPDSQNAIAESLQEQQQAAQPFKAQPTIARLTTSSN